MTDSARFTWMQFYEQLADRFVAFRGRQGELLGLLADLKASGLPIALLEDKDETGARMPLTEIDPWTETEARLLSLAQYHPAAPSQVTPTTPAAAAARALKVS